MKIFVFGNPEVSKDALPIRIMPALRQKMPEMEFVTIDPNEDWDVPPEVIVIDTVLGIDDITLFDDLLYFKKSPRLTLHDFDALANLLYLQKLGRFKKIKIIGLPPTISEEEAVKKIIVILRTILL
jgi:hypothetical protein